MTPEVSILMNCYNGEKYLKECIQSVLNQTFKNWEIIFWDNQSKDKSKEICLSFNDPRIKYFYSEFHTNLYEARNLALQKIKGSFVAFLDTDDIWDKNKLNIQINYFKNDKNVGLVCSNFIFLNEMNNKKKLWHKNKIRSGYVLDNLLKNYFIGLPTVVIRKETIEKLDRPFNPKYNIIGDFDLFTKISQHWKVKYINLPLATYRWHGKNLGFNETDREIKELKNWLGDIKSQKKIINNHNLYYVLHKLQYLIGKQYLRENKYKMAILCLFKLKNSKLFFRLLVQIILPKNVLIFIKFFKFK